jgi:hypothetical protein
VCACAPVRTDQGARTDIAKSRIWFREISDDADFVPQARAEAVIVR